LTELLAYGCAAGLPLFVERLDAPFDLPSGPSGDGCAFERFDLDARRFVYRLVRARDGGPQPARPPFVPVVRSSFAGRPSKGGPVEPLRRVRSDADFGIYLEFEPNPEPFPVSYRLVAPGGRPRLTSPVFIVAPGSGSCGWLHDRRGLLTPGPWEIEARVGGRRVATTTITVF
jgi:hypothetical protein